MRLARNLTIALVAIAILGTLLMTSPAYAWRGHRGGWGWGVGFGPYWGGYYGPYYGYYAPYYGGYYRYPYYPYYYPYYRYRPY
ncbi:MAG: hypothetical protein ABSF90_12770 [Syntrophobacteraceae bacterium]|jgi:hypothetical protein